MKKEKGKRFKKAEKKKKHKFLKIFGILIILILLFILAIGGAVGGYAYSIIKEAPEINPTDIYNVVDKTSYIYDKNGELISRLYDDEDRELITIDKIPDVTKDAIIAIEDKTFYSHKGFNVKRIIGAIISKYTGKSEEISGTSTITQQLARNVFLADIKSERSIERKITEAYYAYQIEQTLTKDEILEAYFNTVYFGFGCYGIQNASYVYFSKDVADLNLEESAILATLPQMPDSYALIKTEETDYTVDFKKGFYINTLCKDRRDLVLDLMVEQNLITKKEAEEAMKPIEDIVNPNIRNKSYKYTWFKDYLIKQVYSDLQKELNLSEDEAYNKLYMGGLKIYSTIDPEIQDIVLEEFKDEDNFPYNYGEKETEGAMVITEVGTGKVLAMVGGRNGNGDNIFNRATSPRQPGSTIKPLSVYSAGLQKSFEYLQNGEEFPFTNFSIDKQGSKYWGRYLTTRSQVTDEKITIDGKTWPQNVTRRYSGRNTFRTALQQSINTCAVKILYQVGLDYSKDMLKKYNISTLVEEGEYNDINPAALALGAMTEGVTPLDMALAYATFPNNGVYNSGIAYTKIEDSNGETILEKKSKETQVLDEGVAWIMTDVLKSVVSRGIAYNASIYGIQVGGKTGTSDSSDNLWFCGFTPKYSASLWLGEDYNAELASTSSQAALFWSKVMEQIPDITEAEYKEQPTNVVYINGDYFIEGTYP